MRALETDLEQKLGQELIYPEDVQTVQRAPDSEAVRRTMIGNRLKHEVRQQRTRYVAFKFLGPDERTAAQPAVQSLKDRYPSLVFLDLSIDPALLIEQRDLFAPFEDMINSPENRP
jgi:hypothetical protein